MFKVTCIICAYSPRMDYLNQTLDSLRAQCFSREDWEFILVDNSSKEPLAGRVDLSGIPDARCFYEAELGVTHARLCGIREARGEIIVFVDDDNILDSQYFSLVWKLFSENRLLGCIGGSLIPRFECEPPVNSEPFWECLALRTVEQLDVDCSFELNAKPYGAGLSLRREIAEQYALHVSRSDSRKRLGRIGNSLGGCEDIDMAYTAVEMGYVCGLFPDLKLTHLIDRKRLNWEYLKKISHDANCSYIELLRSRGLPLPRRIALYRSLARVLLGLLRRPSGYNLSRFKRRHQEVRGMLKALSNI